MKFALFVLALLVLLWLLRRSWRRRKPPPPAARPADAAGADAEAYAVTPMLSCAHCGVHLPRDEALPGRGGVFCDAAHRTAFEAAHPPA